VVLALADPARHAAGETIGAQGAHDPDLE